MEIFQFIKKYKHLLLASLIVFIISFFLTQLVLNIINNSKGKSVKPDEPIQTVGDGVDNIETGLTVLLLGYGGAGHPGGALSDVIMLAQIDKDNQKVYFISIPRDTWIPIPVRSDELQNYKINEAFAIGSSDSLYPLKEPKYKGEHGGGELAKYAAEKVVGFKVDHYLGIDFSGFERAVDILGGLDVDVPVAFDDYFYPVKGLENETCGKSGEEIATLSSTLSGFQLEKQFQCRYEHLHYDKGVQHIDGASALKFVRSRHSEQHGGDFARSQRQQALLEAVRNKVLSFENVNKLVPFTEEALNIIKTDLSENEILDLINFYANYGDYEFVNINLTEENAFNSSKSSIGQFILVPQNGINNFESIHNLIETEMAK